MYEKVKIGLVKNDFIVKDDGNKDTLRTYPREFSSLNGYSIVNAISKEVKAGNCLCKYPESVRSVLSCLI
jgi:hypothetical protein